MIKCIDPDCKKEAQYEVYDQPHCLDHMLEAIDCAVYVEVRRIDELADGDSDKGKG